MSTVSRRRIRNSALLTGAIAAVGYSMPADAVTYQVGSGKPYSTIQAAINQAEADAPASTVRPVIEIYTGTYSEVAILHDDPNYNVSMPTKYDGWTIRAAAGANVRLNGAFVFGQNREMCTLDGINIDNTSSTFGFEAGVSFLSNTARDNVIKNVTIWGHNTVPGNAAVSGSFQYGVNTLDHVTIWNVEYGMTANSNAYYLLKNSIVANATNWGFNSAQSTSSVQYSDLYGSNPNSQNFVSNDGGNLNWGSGLDPMFVTTDTSNPYFLWLHPLSPAAFAAQSGTSMGSKPVFEPIWNVNADGNWSTASNWMFNIVPNFVNAEANFTSAISTPHVVTTDVPVTVGGLKFDNAVSYTINGSNTITLSASNNIASITLVSGTHTINAPLNLASNTTISGGGSLTTTNITNAAALAVQSRVSAGNIDGSGSITVGPGGSLTTNRLRQASATISGSVGVNAGRSTSRTSVVQVLTVNAGGKLDLNDQDLIDDYTGATPLSAIGALIASGYAGGNWNGNGITSSSAAAQAASANKTALGYADNTASGLASFGGQTLDATSILIGYTYAGDADLSGTVDTIDFNLLASSFSQSGKTWFNGDFDYNGTVDTIDFNLLASNFSQGFAAPALGPLVPEPCGAVLLCLAMLTVVRRRRAAHE